MMRTVLDRAQWLEPSSLLEPSIKSHVFSELLERQRRHLFSRIFRPEFVKYLGKPAENCWAQLGNIFLLRCFFVNIISSRSQKCWKYSEKSGNYKVWLCFSLLL